MDQALSILLSHESVEYYTPKEYLDLARRVMGWIDLDPASSHLAQQTVQAALYYTKEENGLSKEWRGRVFLNSPYSKTAGKSNQEIWAKKLISEYRAGRVTEAILLTKSVPGYAWFEFVWDQADAICFVRKLIKFVNPASDHPPKPAKHGSTFFYFGPKVDLFEMIFSEIGRVYPREK